MGGINIAKQPFKFIAGDGSLIFLEHGPLRWIGQRIAEMIDCGYRRSPEEEAEAEEDPRVKMTRDHGLDFPLFNTMLAGC